jgi:hypothetical protein
MRYAIGDKIVAICFKLSDPGMWNYSYSVQDLEQIAGLEIVTLTVKEHHKVGWEHRPLIKEYDGFVLADESGNVWHNQYPNASYGQMDDSHDYVFDNITYLEKMIAEDTHDLPYEYVDLSRYLSSLRGEIHRQEKHNKKEVVERLNTVLNYILDVVTQQGYTVSFGQLMFNCKPVPGRYDVTITRD